MSHYSLFLCLPVADDNWRAAADAAMEPFRIDDETGLGEWDHWHTDGAFWVRPECVDDPLIVPSSQWPGDPLRCDGGPRRVLDIAGMRSAAVETGRELWAAWQEAVGRNPPARSIDHFRELFPEGQSAWTAYYAQPLLREVLGRSRVDDDVFRALAFEDSDFVGYFGGDQRRFLDRRAESAVMAYALVTMDGRWFDAEATPGYASLLRSHIDGLPDDAFLIELDCHG